MMGDTMKRHRCCSGVGYDEAGAAQLVTRKLLASGVAPLRQGDARGWKCLLFGGRI
jgi:hypothetical protein